MQSEAKTNVETFDTGIAAIQYVRAHPPALLLLENVENINKEPESNTELSDREYVIASTASGTNLSGILAALQESNYTVHATTLNSKQFGLAQERRRLYIAAIRNDMLEDIYPRTFGESLDFAIAAFKMEPLPVEAFLLPEDAPEIEAALEEVAAEVSKEGTIDRILQFA